ncbi:MAG: hypothetical protein IKQ77_03040 [Prevotella sp.]|nr:hypothetical protein [Prevotella sp.]
MAEKKIGKKSKGLEPKIKCDHSVKLYEDGKYHWMYDVNLLKNPAVLIDVFKVLGWTVGIVAFFIAMVQACENGMHAEDMLFGLKLIGIMMAVMFVLGILGYLIYAAMSGWVYSAHFTMDEQGVVHEQSARADKVAKRIGCLTIIVALLARKPGVAGTGILAASRTTMSSKFSSVKMVKAIRRMNTIKVNERFQKNRVYVSDEDFDFVYDYIASRCTNAKIK